MKRNSGLQKRWLRNTLSILFAIVLLCVIALSIMVAAYYYSSMEAGMEAKARTSTSFFDNYVRQSYNEYYQSCAKFAQSFDSKDQMELQFVNTNNRIVASSYGVYSGMAGVTSDIREAIETKAIASYTGTNPATGERIMAVSSPLIYTNGEVIGVLRYVTSLRRADRQIMLFSLCAALVGLIVLLVVYVSGRYFVKSILVPVQELTATAKRISAGSYGVQIPRKSDDEIGELCTDFEEMRRRLKESAEEKLESERQNKELISNISHDLKTPITAVKGYVEGIMDGVADTPEKQEKYIRTIYNKANDMERLINELTFYSKIDTNRIPYTFDRINVNAYFADCVEELSLELEEQNIELAYFNYVDEDVQVIADAEQIKRVINNIVSNSIKYIDKPKGYINIRVKDVGDFVQVEIEDNGKGIATKDLPLIFNRFYRTDASRNSSKGGSGIGLSIVKKIIEDHGGKVWATSKENTGTVMYFVLRKYQEVPAT